MSNRKGHTQVLSLIAAIAMVLIASASDAATAGKGNGKSGSTGFTEDECKALDGTVSPAPGPQPNTFECCFGNDCFICSAKGCDEVDWGDVITKKPMPAGHSSLALPATNAVGPHGTISTKPHVPAVKRTVRDHRKSAQPNTRAAKAPAGAGYTDGGQCTVVDGPNMGKKGTFDGSSCCSEKDWGCTDCKSTSGNPNGKCQAGIQSSILVRPEFSGVDSGRNRVYHTR